MAMRCSRSLARPSAREPHGRSCSLRQVNSCDAVERIGLSHFIELLPIMSDFDALFESIGPIAERIQDLQRQAGQQYKPVVEDILHSGCRDGDCAS